MKTISLVLFSFFIQFGLFAQKDIQVEPAFWWVGMENSNLELMVYGENIAELSFEMDYPGVELIKQESLNNPNYLFIQLHVSQKTTPGNFDLVFKKKKKEVYRYTYELKKRDADSKNREGFNSKDIVYLITPDRFANGNPENDHVQGLYPDTDRSVKDKRHGGDIQGIINQLDYIQNLGFTAIWICPMLESNQPIYSYHGYAITNYYKIDPRYGTNEDYLKLVQEAKSRGIKVIMDQVLNHNGRYHFWSSDLPSTDWYHYSDQMDDPPFTSHQRTVLADPHAPESEKKAFSDGWFVDRMPDLNQKNSHLATYLIQNSIFWIEYAGLQGIRQDTYSYPDPKFTNQWSKSIMEEYPNFNIVGEEWSYNPAIVARWQRGKVNADGFESNAPSMMDFPNQEAIVNALNKEKEPWKNSFDAVYLMLANDFLYPDPNNLMTILDNHDMPRIYDQLNGRLDLMKMALIYLYSTRGIPQVYYGTEILMSYPENPGDHGGLRIDMPGGWEGDTINAFEKKGLSEAQLDMMEFIRQLNAIRTSHKAMQEGKLFHYSPKDEVYVMFRVLDDELIMTVFNKNPDSAELSLERFEEIIKGNKNALDLIDQTELDISQGSLSIEPNSARILRILP